VDAGKDAILEEGNNANITYTGYSADPSVTLDEDTLSRMTNADDEEGYDLVIGSGAFIAAYTSTENPEKNHDSFENQLIGMKAGETRTITVTFPDSYSYNEALQGVEVSFDVTLNSISVQDNPTELTDDLISDYTGGEYTSASDFTDYLRSYYKGQVAYQALYDAIEILGYPENVIEEYVEEYVSEYLDYYYDEDEEVSEDELTSVREQATENAQETIGERLVWNYLFDYYQVTMTKAEYTAAIEENYNAYSTYYYYYYGLTDVSDFEDYFGRDYLISEFKYRTLVEKLADLITFE
jgi:FKBP-type peptidyl-prolyl cis-trans isomerase (trigger factor)